MINWNVKVNELLTGNQFTQNFTRLPLVGGFSPWLISMQAPLVDFHQKCFTITDCHNNKQWFANTVTLTNNYSDMMTHNELPYFSKSSRKCTMSQNEIKNSNMTSTVKITASN